MPVDVVQGKDATNFRWGESLPIISNNFNFYHFCFEFGGEGFGISVGLLISVKGYCNRGEKSGMCLFPSVTMTSIVSMRDAQGWWMVDIYILVWSIEYTGRMIPGSKGSPS